MSTRKRTRGRCRGWLGLVLALAAGWPVAAEEPKPQDADVAAGWTAFEAEDEPKARAAWERALKRGVAAAYAGLGMIELQGIGGRPRNDVEARRLFELGAAKKDPQSILRLAVMLGRGHGGDEDMARARQMLNELIVAHRDKDAETTEEAEGVLYSLEQEHSFDAMPNDAQEAIEEEEQWKAALADDARPGAAEYRAGWEAFGSGEYARALAAYQESAAKGYTAAFADLGLLYRGGLGLKADAEEARRLFAHGAAKGDGAAIVYLADAWRDGTGGPRDLAQAKYWYEKAVHAADVRRPHRLTGEAESANLSEQAVAAKPIAIEPPRLLAAPAPTKPAPAGAAATASTVSKEDMQWGVLYEERKKKGYRGSPQEEQRYAAVLKALSTPVSAPSAPPGQAEYEQGMAAYKEKKIKVAVDHWRKAAEAGYVPAMVELGLTLEVGEGDVKEDPKTALRWLQKAADAGDFDGLLGVGRAFRDGKAVEFDLAKAQAHFQKVRTQYASNPQAVAAVDRELQILMGSTPNDAFILGRGNYRSQKHAEARKWFLKSAEGGNHLAMANLATLYANGHGGPKDPRQALVWAEKAQALGNKAAGMLVPGLKARLLGWDELTRAEEAQTARKYAEARGWYEKAAAAGNVDAMVKLARLYQDGIAVIKNERKAIEWYEKAEKAGDDFAADEIYSLRQVMQFRDQAIAQNRLRDSIDGVSRPGAAAKKGSPVPFDSLIKHTPWTPAEILAAVKSGADSEALAVALRTDKAVDFYDGDYRRLLALPEGAAIDEWGNLNGALIEQKKPGAGKWAQDLAAAAIAARRAQLKLTPVVDSAELRARAQAGDAVALYELNVLPEAGRKLGPLPPELTKNYDQLRELVRAANYAPAFWLIGESLTYNADASKKDLYAAAEFFRRSAEAGNARGADKLSATFHAPGDAVAAPNFFEVEAWLIEAAARAMPGEFSVMPPDHKLYLLYGGTDPVGYGSEMRTSEEDLRWLRELIRRGGPAGELATIYVQTLRRRDGDKVDNILKAMPPEVAPFPAAEVTRLETAAKGGEVAAMLKLAEALASGRGLRQHDARAVEYYRQAAVRGSVPAMRRLAWHHDKGYGAKKDVAERIAWMEKAAAAGEPRDAFDLAVLLGQQPEKTHAAKIVALLEKAIAGGVPEAPLRLSGFYQYGWAGVEKSADKAIAVLLKAAEKGDQNVYASLAYLYGSEKNAAASLLWLRKAWDAGEKSVAVPLAKALISAGERAEGVKFYKVAADAGNAEAQFMLPSLLEEDGNAAEAQVYRKKLLANSAGEFYWKYVEREAREYDEELNAAPGSDVFLRKQAKAGDSDAMIQYAQRIAQKDRDDALAWLRAAVGKGNPQAMLMLANEIAATDKPGALKLIREAADKGSHQGMTILANQLYATDKAEALQWIQKAAEAGNADAKFQYGGMLYQGRDVPQDQARGLELMNAGVEGGSLAATFEMGRASMQGMPGLPANPARGIELLQKAAAANVPQAAFVLGEIHERGVGTPANLFEALKWYRQADRLGIKEARAAINRLEVATKGQRPPTPAAKPAAASPADKK